MKLSDLKHLADYLIDQGISPDTPICIWNGQVEEVQELCGLSVLASGPYRFDPSPKLGGNALLAKGQYVLMEATTQEVPEQIRQRNN